MRLVLRRFHYILWLFALSLLFNNCGKFNAAGISTESSGTETLSSSGSPNQSTDGESVDQVQGVENQFVIGPSLDDRTCFRDYLTVFPWDNPAEDLTEVAPMLNSQKIQTIKMLKDQPAPVPQRPDGWFISAYVMTKPDGSTHQAIKFNKGDNLSLDSLDCYIMRLNATSSSTTGLANLAFQNIGIDNNLNTLIGFLRSREQFIACKVSRGVGSIIIAGDQGRMLEIPANKPFVIKRGCYQ